MTNVAYFGHPATFPRTAIDKRACPFCRSPEQTELEVENGEWVVVCHDCNAIGPAGQSSGAAVRRWNGD